MRTKKRAKSDVLSVEEIYRRFPGEWVLLADPEVDRNQNVLCGKLVWHSKGRDEVYQKDIDLRLRESATLYTGTMPEGTAIIL